MAFKAFTTKKRYEELKKNPLVFCVFSEKTFFFERRPHTEYGWESCDSTVDFFQSVEGNMPELNQRELFFAGKQIFENGEIDEKKEDDDRVSFEIEVFNAYNAENWIKIFKDCYYNFKAGNTSHYPMSLFWAIYNKDWKEDTLNRALLQCEKVILEIVVNGIKDKLYLFSNNKQIKLVKILKQINPNVQALEIPLVETALKELSPSTTFHDYGFYDKIDYIISFGKNEDENNILNQLYTTSTNIFIHYKYWIQNEGFRWNDYSNVLEIYSFVSIEEQMHIIKRYLHDIRINITNLNDEILAGFRNYKYPNCVYGRYYISAPGSNMSMAAPMFADAVLTLKKTNGQHLQTFNGILDLVITHSNRAYPKIEFDVYKFLPSCDGGLIPNVAFKGFIHYDVHYSLDESLLTEENLKSTVNYILEKYAIRQMYWGCTSDNKELPESEVRKCKTLYTILKKEHDKDQDRSCSCLKQMYYNPDRWSRRDNMHDNILKICFDDTSKIQGTFTLEDVSLEHLETVIRKLSQKYTDVVYHNDNIQDKFKDNDFAKYIFQKFYKGTKIDIYPYGGVFLSSTKSLLKVWEPKELVNMNSSEVDKFVQSHESYHVYRRTWNVLKEMCQDGIIYDDHISIEYDKDRLHKIKTLFYYRAHIYTPKVEDNTRLITNNDKINYWELKFLVPQRIYYTKYCTPKISEEKEKVSDLPFYLCNTKSCFYSCLEDQTLEKNSNWKGYTLYHAAEIIGYKLIIEHKNGYMANNVVSNFAAELRQAEKFYPRLICRSCGHMIFSTKGTFLNGSRTFRCENTNCVQYYKDIYLSNCNTCGGLIDSRDSQRCPNNWVICPSCLACCNDVLYQTLYDQRMRAGRITDRLRNNLGKGHNDKNLFFCPKCGGQIGEITIKEQYVVDGEQMESERKVQGCIICNEEYQQEISNYNNSIQRR